MHFILKLQKSLYPAFKEKGRRSRSELSQLGVHQPLRRFGPILTKYYVGIRTKPNGKANQRASALIRFRSDYYLKLVRFRPVSAAFGERSKRRRTFAQKVRIFGRE